MLKDKSRSLIAFNSFIEFEYDQQVEFETVFIPRLKLILELLDVSMETFLYIQEKKINSCCKITRLIRSGYN